jgi:hypothetical protein
MRFILMTLAGPEHVEAWERGSADDKREEIARVEAWFREHSTLGRIKGGEELDRPSRARTVRGKGVTDGPFVETKEILGGFIVIDVPDMTTALEVAAGWPGLAWDGDAVEVRPAGSAEGEAEAQAASDS